MQNSWRLNAAQSDTEDLLCHDKEKSREMLTFNPTKDDSKIVTFKCAFSNTTLSLAQQNLQTPSSFKMCWYQFPAHIPKYKTQPVYKEGYTTGNIR